MNPKPTETGPASTPAKTPGPQPGAAATAEPEPIELVPESDKADPSAQPQDDPGAAASPQPGTHRIPPWQTVMQRARLGSKLAAGLVVVAAVAGTGTYVYLANQKSAKLRDGKTIAVQDGNAEFDGAAEKQIKLGSQDQTLTVQGKSNFKGRVGVQNDVNVDGQLDVVGTGSFSKLVVTGPTQLASAEVKSNLVVNGTTQLQGAVSFKSLLTAAAGLNVVGSSSFSGEIVAAGLNVSNATINGTTRFNGHLTSSGPTPGISGTVAGGPGGTVSISGNDTAGTLNINVGVGGSAGILANISFRSPFGGTPRVILSPVGSASSTIQYYVNRSSGGFSVGSTTTPGPGSYSFDYLVVQ
ncbi:MAG TPA: hypothetical protein VK963_02855 [Candidatus Saccharimonadales bacterium]|nr:hypothetical protein [Candidatus Saccharimonadales bacterium]